ncbi:MAG TPA: protein translocase subunit SecD [Actinomycetota bacterium]|nr:protein translocase subunit SecD [Actinomycetota bacterium]
MRNVRGLWASLIFVLVLAAASAAGLITGAAEPLLGLDLQGGVSVILSAPDGTPDDVMERALENIRNRVDAFGVGEPDIFLSATTIEVQIPGSSESRLEARPVDLTCLVGEDAEGDPVTHGCADDRALVEDALQALAVEPQPSEVCLTTGDEELGCYGSEQAAAQAQAGISVQPQASPTPTAAPSASPTATVGPEPPPSSFCLTDPTGAELACFDTRADADDALAAIETEVTARTWCVIDASGREDEDDDGAATPTATPSPSPSGLLALDPEGAEPPPCGLPSRTDADAALASIAVQDIEREFCVVGSAGDDLGCSVFRAAAEELQRETGQQRLLQVIGETARLEQRAVLEEIPPQDPRWATTPLTCETPEERERPSCSFDALADEEVVYLREDGSKLRLGPVIIAGDNIDRARATLQGGGATGVVTEWGVEFQLDGQGSDAFADATRAAVGAPPPQNAIAIVVDRVVISDPVVNEPITNGSGVISGGFDEQSAKDLATQLNAGALPVELTRQSVRTVSPTLGDESLRQSVVAGLVGLGLLFLYLIFYYRILGVVASVGMLTWSLLALGMIGLAGESFGYALTLAGVAGLLISLGVTADSYIVFFERIKDEIRNGRSARSAVQPAFRRSFRTLVAADIVTGIAAAVLYVTAVSSVRGFALTLGVAVLLDLFMIWFYKRAIVFLLARSRRIASMRGFGLLPAGVGRGQASGAEATR